MKILRGVVTALMCTPALAGCASVAVAPLAATNESDVPGSNSVPADYREQILAYVKANLKDPYSLKSAGVSGPRHGFVGLLFGGQGWFVCARFNGKNSFGAYIGIIPTTYIFKDSKILAAVENGPACLNVVEYQPFPELENIT